MKTLIASILVILCLTFDAVAQAPPILRQVLTTNLVPVVAGTNVVVVNSGTNLQINATSGSAYTIPNYQIGTVYTNVTGDLGNLVICSNSATFTLTIPQAGSAGFPSGWWYRVLNLGSGSLVLSPAVGNINGAATRSINTRDGGIVMSDGTNYNFINGKVYQVMQHAAASTQYRSVQASDTSGTSYTDGAIVGDATRTNANVLGSLTADSVKSTNLVTASGYRVQCISASTGNSYTPDYSLTSQFLLLVTTNFTLANPINTPASGCQRVTYRLRQDSTNGQHTITFGSLYAFGKDITGVTLSTNVNMIDYMTVDYASDLGTNYVVGYVRGY